ncbi:hypothetical protein COOONC_18940, partial [Cooperia oncophora]
MCSNARLRAVLHLRVQIRDIIVVDLMTHSESLMDIHELNDLWPMAVHSSKIDYTLLIIGLIVSIILSILLSFFCCLLCNGCWLHRRRNPHLYETVNESGWYPI